MSAAIALANLTKLADGELVLYDALLDAGTDLGLAHFGARALNSLRLEKSFGTWAREYRPLYTPGEAGVEAPVDKLQLLENYLPGLCPARMRLPSSKLHRLPDGACGWQIEGRSAATSQRLKPPQLVPSY